MAKQCNIVHHQMAPFPTNPYNIFVSNIVTSFTPVAEVACLGNNMTSPHKNKYGIMATHDIMILFTRNGLSIPF